MLKRHHFPWLTLVDDFRTADWVKLIPYPEFAFNKTAQLLQLV